MNAPRESGNPERPQRIPSDRGALWVWGQNGLTLAVLILGPVFPGPWQWPVSWWAWSATLAGAILLMLGAFFGLAGVRALGRNRTPYPKPREYGQLVQHGIYRVVRHPLYSSLILLSWGWALLWRSWPTAVAALALTLLLYAKARLEERWMQAKFPAYAGYAQRVKHFVPLVY